MNEDYNKVKNMKEKENKVEKEKCERAVRNHQECWVEQSSKWYFSNDTSIDKCCVEWLCETNECTGGGRKTK